MIEILMMREVATSRKARVSTMRNKTYLSLCVFDCDFQDALLILISLNMILHLKFL